MIHWSEGLIQILLGGLLCTVTAEHRGCRSEGLPGLTLWARQTRLRQFSHHAMDGAVTGQSREHWGLGGSTEEKPLTQLLGSAGCLFGGNFQTESPGVYSISHVYQAGRTFWAESTVRAKVLKPKRGETGEKDHCALSKGWDEGSSKSRRGGPEQLESQVGRLGLSTPPRGKFQASEGFKA